MLRAIFYSLLVLATPAAAQNCTQTVPVLLADRDTGALIEPLTPKMVTAKIGAAPLLISGTARIRSGRIVVLIDESGSMNDTDTAASSANKAHALNVVKRTLRDLMAALPPGVSIEYGLFNEKWAFSEGFTSDPEKLREAVEETIAHFEKRGHGHTALRDALHEALLRFGTPQPGDSILLLTDGGENASKLTARQLEHDFRAAHVRVLTMMVYEYNLVSEEEVGRDWLEDLVEKTGGSSLVINASSQSWSGKKDNPANVAMIHRFWNDRVLSTNVIQVQVPGTVTSETKWKLSVNREADARLKHATIVYPDRLSPCPVAAAEAH